MSPVTISNGSHGIHLTAYARIHESGTHDDGDVVYSNAETGWDSKIHFYIIFSAHFAILRRSQTTTDADGRAWLIL